MSDKSHRKARKIPISHVPSPRKPLKFLVYILSAVLFNFLSRNSPSMDDIPQEGREATMLGRFQNWMYKRSKAYFRLLVVILVLLYFADLTLFSGVFPLQMYGLVLDIIGAVIMARGIFRGFVGIMGDANLNRPSAGNQGSQSPMEVRSLDAEVRSTVDGLQGALLLIVGFLVQIIAVSGMV